MCEHQLNYYLDVTTSIGRISSFQSSKTAFNFSKYADTCVGRLRVEVVYMEPDLYLNGVISLSTGSC